MVMSSVIKTLFDSEICKWRSSKDDGTKKLVKARKRAICKKMRLATGLRMFQPCPRGGSTNTGGVCKKALQRPKLLSKLLSSKKCKIPPKLIKKFYNLGIALNCTRQIDPDGLQRLGQDLKECYYNHVNWYPLCSAVHKNVEHSHQSLRRLQAKSRILTLGHLSETNLEVYVIP